MRKAGGWKYQDILKELSYKWERQGNYAFQIEIHPGYNFCIIDPIKAHRKESANLA